MRTSFSVLVFTLSLSFSALAQTSLFDVCSEVVKNQTISESSKQYCLAFIEKSNQELREKEEKKQLLTQIKKSIQANGITTDNHSVILIETLACSKKSETTYSCTVDLGPQFLCPIGDRGESGSRLVNDDLYFQADNSGNILLNSSRRLSGCPD